MVQKMLESSTKKVGVMIPLFKKGDRMDVNNFWGVCLQTMGCRVLARVIAKRV